MNIEDIIPKNRPRIKTVARLKSTISDTLPDTFTRNRKASTTGTVINAITGHNGELFFVEHDDKTVSTYHHTELNPEQP